MDPGTRAIVQLAWSRHLGLPDAAMAPAGEAPTQATRSSKVSDSVLMTVVLGGSVVAVGPEHLLPALAALSDQQLSDGSTLLGLVGGRGRLLGEAVLLFTDSYVADAGQTAVEVDDDLESVRSLERHCPPDDVLEVGLSGWSGRSRSGMPPTSSSAAPASTNGRASWPILVC